MIAWARFRAIQYPNTYMYCKHNTRSKYYYLHIQILHKLNLYLVYTALYISNTCLNVYAVV